MTLRRNRRSTSARASLRSGMVCVGLSWMLGASNGVLADQAAWENSYQKDGITVATRPVEGSSIRAFRGETEVEASVDSLLAVLGDPDSCTRWIHNCKSARILASTGFYQRDTYQVNDMPWPVEDRDIVLEIQIDELSDGRFRLNMINHPDALPETDLVRIRQTEGFYLLTPLSANRTKVEWEQHADPGGTLPAWLINQLLVDVPVNTLKQLRQIATEAPYRDQQLKRDASGQIVGWTKRDSNAPQIGALLRSSDAGS